MNRLLLAAAALCFLLSFGYTLFALGAGRFRPGRFNLLAMLGGFAGQLAYLYLRGLEVQSCPLHTLFDLLIFLSWSITLIYLVVGPAYRLSLLGAFTSPLVLVLTLIALVLPHPPAAPTPFANPWVEFHAALSIIAYGCFGLASVAGVMYLLQERQLKNRKASALLYHLPPINDLATANKRLVSLGLILLTVAFAAGFVSGLPIVGLKFWASTLIWLLYGGLLLLWRAHALAPRRIATLSVGVFAFALILLPGIHYLSLQRL
ncbi:MAG TPA: cytochrome c biogenesis protein CcsA [Chthoniobacterales bacterium]